MADAILLLQAERPAVSPVRDLLERAGAEVFPAAPVSAVPAYERLRPDLVVLDDPSGDAAGLDVLAALVARDAAVLAVAAPGTPVAVRALSLGAEQLLVTPVVSDQLSAAVDRVRARVDLRRERSWWIARRLEQGGLAALGPSTAMRALARRIEQAAGDGGRPLLLAGEVGTGKRWAARMVHHLDLHRRGPFLDAGAPGRLTAEDLFGREAGAQDGGPRRAGVLDLAHRGSVFLGEIGALALDVQVGLTTVLDTGTLHRIGGARDLAVDARLLAASTRDLPAAVRAGALHAALYERLRPHTIRLPALRERSREDRIALLEHLVAALGRQLPDAPSECAPDAMERLISAPWPGNVRELRAAVERSLLLARGAARLGLRHLPADLREGRAPEPDASERAARPVPLVEVERACIEQALRYHHGNRTRAAHDLGISRATLINKIKVYALDL